MREQVGRAFQVGKDVADPQKVLATLKQEFARLEMELKNKIRQARSARQWDKVRQHELELRQLQQRRKQEIQQQMGQIPVAPVSPARTAFNLDQFKKGQLTLDTPAKIFPRFNNLHQLFDGDNDAVDGFLDSLDEHELRIIKEQPHKSLEIKLRVEDDLNETAKSLEMED